MRAGDARTNEFGALATGRRELRLTAPVPPLARASQGILPSVTAPFDAATLERLGAPLRALGLDFEIDLFEAVRRKAPDHELALEALGLAYTQRGHLSAGLEADRRLAELRPDDAVVQYNLACGYALVNDTDLGIACLERAIELGYDDREHLENDRDLDSIRGDRRFPALLRKLVSPKK